MKETSREIAVILMTLIMFLGIALVKLAVYGGMFYLGLKMIKAVLG